MYAKKQFLDDNWGRTCFDWLQETRPGKKEGSTWRATFLLRSDLSREELTKWLHNKSISWKKKRRLIQAITLTFPCSKWLWRIKCKPNAECSVRKISAVPTPGGEAEASDRHLREPPERRVPWD